MTVALLNFSVGPVPSATGFMTYWLPEIPRMVAPKASTTVGGGGPMVPSPFRSWWKEVSSVSNPKSDPATTAVALAV